MTNNHSNYTEKWDPDKKTKTRDLFRSIAGYSIIILILAAEFIGLVVIFDFMFDIWK